MVDSGQLADARICDAPLSQNLWNSAAAAANVTCSRLLQGTHGMPAANMPPARAEHEGFVLLYTEPLPIDPR